MKSFEQKVAKTTKGDGVADLGPVGRRVHLCVALRVHVRWAGTPVPAMEWAAIGVAAYDTPP